MLRAVIAVGLLVPALVLSADNVSVANQQQIARQAGEAQSTVVAPGLKPTQCASGRFLVTDDSRHPPQSGVVTGRDLDALGGPDIPATFEEAPGQTQSPGVAVPAGTLFPRYEFGTADHDLVVLSNGDVLYITGAFSRRPTDAAWAKDTFRGDFGPNARSVVLVWRSTDCGKTFQFRGELDPVSKEDGSCALPQFRTDENKKKILTPPWDMGGSDGQLARVDPSNDHVFLTFRCVGYNKKSSTTKFELDPDAPLNKTMVLRSTDSGKTWDSLGFVTKVNRWRLGVVPVDTKTLAFGWDDKIFLGKKSSGSEKFTFEKAKKAPGGGYGWDHGFPMLGRRDNPYLKALIWARTVTGFSPKGCFIVYPDTIADDKGHGFRLFFFNAQTGEFGDPEDPIGPEAKGVNDFLFHPVIIDGGDGPPLLYWYDIDWASKSATIRGRFITGDGKFTDDFTISRANGKDRSFKLEKECPQDAYWYGDYQTAGGGFVKPPGAGPTVIGTTFSYFPMWIEPDDAIHFTRVDFTVPPNMKDLVGIVEHTVPRSRFTRRPVIVDPLRFVEPPGIIQEMEEHERQQPERPQ